MNLYGNGTNVIKLIPVLKRTNRRDRAAIFLHRYKTMAASPAEVYNQLKHHLQNLNDKQSDIFLIEFQNNPANIGLVLELLKLKTDINQYLLLALSNLMNRTQIDPDFVFGILSSIDPSFHVLKCWYHFMISNNYHRMDELLSNLDDRLKLSFLTIFLENKNNHFQDLSVELVQKYLHTHYQESLELLCQLLTGASITFGVRKQLLQQVLAIADVEEIELVSDVIIEFLNDRSDFQGVYNWMLDSRLLMRLQSALAGNEFAYRRSR